jgi:hypothetical protein
MVAGTLDKGESCGPEMGTLDPGDIYAQKTTSWSFGVTKALSARFV